MASLHYRFEVVLRLIWALLLISSCNFLLYAQGPCGGKPCPVIKARENSSSSPVSTPVPRPKKPGSGSRTPKPVPPEPVCEDAELIVVCGMPGCEITLNGKDRSVTDDLGGITFQVEGNQRYRVRVTKPGYETYEKTEQKLGCSDGREVSARLKAKPVTLRIRTLPAECNIYLDGVKQPSGSDSKGLFSHVLEKPTLLIEAKKQGYLSATKNLFLAPELASQEIVLTLEPISATLRLSANVENAIVTVDNQKSASPISEKLLLPPGSHIIGVDALGYSSVKFEISVGPDESVTKEVILQRLPVASLEAGANTLFSRRAYDDVLNLARYIFEVDPANATAHRLVGLVSLERADFANASTHLEQALAGGESVALRVRRHPGEKFALNRGHDSCDAQLILSNTEVEFKSLRNPAENFKVPDNQIQVIGIQIRNSVAVYLSTKVTVSGKRRDYNFYSYDKELTQAGKPYLEMIQRLLRFLQAR